MSESVQALVARLRALHEAATEGPWNTVGLPWDDESWIVAGNGDPHIGETICSAPDYDDIDPESRPWLANMRLITEMRNALPTLLGEVQAARSVVYRARFAVELNTITSDLRDAIEIYDDRTA